MPIELSSKDIGGRIQEVALKLGIRSAKELFERMEERGYEVKLGGIRRHWERRLVPSTPYVVAYSDFLSVSSDWLLFGKQLASPSVSELKQIVARMIEDAGGTTPTKDPTLAEIDILLARIEPTKREAIVQLLRTMAASDDNPM